jgi:SAM-dependent methyltransferase
MRAFGRPQGILGRLGGIIMASTNEGCGAWVIDLLEVGPNDNVLEVGFGPGVVIQRLAKLASEGYVAGIDPSREMVQQARARNATAIQNGRASRSAKPQRGFCVSIALAHQSAFMPWMLHTRDTVPRPAVEEICNPFINQIAVSPVRVFRQRMSLLPSPL